MPSNQRQIIEQAKCTYSPLTKAFKKEATEEQKEKQIKAFKIKTKNKQRHFKTDLKRNF